MQRKSRGGDDSEKQYQFDSAFPMDETMRRLHDQMEHIHSGWGWFGKYTIWSEKRRDSIQFEIVKRPARSTHKVVITGLIREIDRNQSALECQVQETNPKRHIALLALPLFLAILLMATYYGPFQLQEALLPCLVVSGVLLYVLAPKRFPELGADDIAHIENALGYHESRYHTSGKNKAKPAPD